VLNCGLWYLTLTFPAWLNWGLILVVAFPVIGGLTTILAEFFMRERRGWARWKRGLILGGGILGILGAVVGAVVQARDSYNLQAVTTGGEGYCYLQYEISTSTAMKFVAFNSGALPVYDATFEITDLTRWQDILAHDNGASGALQNPDNLFKWNQETKVNLQLGNFRPTEARFVWEAPKPKDELQRYYISIWARNGFLEEELLLRQVDGGQEVTAMRIWKKVPDGAGRAPKVLMLVEGSSDRFKAVYPQGIPWTPHLTGE